MIGHWDDVPWEPHAHGELRFERQRLSRPRGGAGAMLSRYPDSQKIAVRRLGIIAPVQALSYWEGEE